MIDTVLAWNQPVVPAKFDELAHVAGVAGGGKAFIDWLSQLKADVGIAGGLSAYGVKHEQIAQLAAIANQDSAIKPIRASALRRISISCLGRQCETAAVYNLPVFISLHRIEVDLAVYTF